MTEQATGSVHKTNLRVAAIVLAAGEARRMGSAKGLLPWRGETLLRHCVRTALASHCDEVFVVLGAGATELEGEISDLGVRVLEHESWRDGMGSSLAFVAQQISDQLDGALILLCDQPFVTPELIDQLISSAGKLEMSASKYGETIGAPAYFSASTFPRLRSLRGDRGAKALLVERQAKIATVPFPDGAIDIDNPDDYERAIAELRRRSR